MHLRAFVRTRLPRRAWASDGCNGCEEGETWSRSLASHEGNSPPVAAASAGSTSPRPLRAQPLCLFACLRCTSSNRPFGRERKLQLLRDGEMAHQVGRFPAAGPSAPGGKTQVPFIPNVGIECGLPRQCQRREGLQSTKLGQARWKSSGSGRAGRTTSTRTLGLEDKFIAIVAQLHAVFQEHQALRVRPTTSGAW